MGVLYVRDVDSGTWNPTSTGLQGPIGPQGPAGPAGPAGSITTPLLIPDPVGVNYPALRFQEGDGANGTGPSPYNYEWNLYNDHLRLFSSRQPAKVLAEFARPATDVAEFGLQDWWLNAQSDGYLRFHYGVDRLTAEMWLDSNGGLGLRGGGSFGSNVAVTGWMTAYNVTASQNNVYGGGQLILQSGNANQTNLQVGATNGSPNPGVYVVGSPVGNDWSQRPLIIAKHAGAGEAALGYVNHTNGWTASFQMYSDGTLYLASVNGANSGVIKMQASQFQVISTGKFKAEQTVLAGSLARRIIEHVKPVRFRDLQHEMAFEASSEPAHNVVREPQPPVEPLYRYGLIAEELAEIMPELSDETRYGRGLDMSGVIAVMWKGMKELFEEVTELRQELADIRGYPGGAAT